MALHHFLVLRNRSKVFMWFLLRMRCADACESSMALSACTPTMIQ